MRYITNCALQIRGDRVEKGAEIELSEDEAAAIDPADITAVEDIPEPEPEPEEPPVGEMTVSQLRRKASALGLSASGSKADLEERIRLHLEGGEAAEEEELAADNQ